MSIPPCIVVPNQHRESFLKYCSRNTIKAQCKGWSILQTLISSAQVIASLIVLILFQHQPQLWRWRVFNIGYCQPWLMNCIKRTQKLGIIKGDDIGCNKQEIISSAYGGRLGIFTGGVGGDVEWDGTRGVILFGFLINK